ncbi:GH14905 [Drosophila grimshawi]|uniref:GH14905 n=2 Tax=Drosophila grimshawi TaxID=7222 RepID=B4J255_DROGR|nr:GH14905 [Drosophila grimshawi]
MADMIQKDTVSLSINYQEKEVRGEYDPEKFTVRLNGQKDLEQRLKEFKAACDAHEKHARKRRRRCYYHIGLMAKVVMETTHDELRRLLEHGTYTFHVDMVAFKSEELSIILETLSIAISAHTNERELRIATGLAIEINGDCCRVGRLRNNCTTMLARGSVVTLTTNTAYRYAGFREIVYVINLGVYLKSVRLNDIILIGKEVRCRVVKTLKEALAVLIIDAGLLASYDFIELPRQCHSLAPEVYPDLFMDDLKMAVLLKANFVVLPKIRCKNFLRAVRMAINEEFDLKLIGCIDFEYVRTNMLDLLGIIKLLDYIWIPDMFNVNCCVYNYIMEDALPIAHCQKKPVIGTVPLERCNDLKRFELHEFLWKIDTIHMQKSPWCNKYPLIVKKLMPIKDYRVGVVQTQQQVKSILTSYQTIVNFIIRTIATIECQAIFVFTKCENASVALARTEIYCPVYMMMPLNEYDDETSIKCKFDLARALHLRRNTHPILYTADLNECNYSPIEFGVDYMRRKGCLEVGDFVVTLEVGKEDNENIVLGIGEDVCILRAFYVAPVFNCEKFKYGT